MVSVTFLGHQGWMVATKRARICIDPLLTDAFGHRGRLGRLFPPRVVDFAEFPPVDAVMVTHEHDDHFDLPSLAHFDRRIPIWLSAGSSVAAEGALQGLGFSVQRLRPGAVIEIGDLRYRAFAPDPRAEVGDEWDVLPLAVHDAAGEGSFVSSVDVRPSAAMLEALGRDVPPGVWAYANNFTSTRFVDARAPAAVSDSAGDDDFDALVAAVVRRYDTIAAAWAPPTTSLVCGAGWSFPDDRAWLDHHVFPVAPSRLAAALQRRRPSGTFAAAEVGRTIGGRDDAARWIRPVDAPPDRTWTGPGQLSDYAPACGRTRPTAADEVALEAGLADFARALYGTAVFRSLCAWPQASVALALRVPGGTWTWRYEPRACAFVRDDHDDPIETFASGLEAWATDLAALFDGEIGPSALCYAGRMRAWNRAPSRLAISPFALWRFAHPLRRPEAAARLYARIVDGLGDLRPRICAR